MSYVRGVVGLLGVFAVSLCPPAAWASESTLAPELRERCLAILRDGLASNEFWPSMHAAEALTLAAQTAEVRAALEPRLDTEQDGQRRCGLARELARTGDRTYASVMLDLLAAQDSYAHVHAAESLFKVGEIGDGRLLRAALARDENPPLQIMAAAALARCGSPAALAVLRKQLQHDDLKVSRIAAWALARVGDASDLPRLRTALKRADDAPTRAYFEHALALLGDAAGRQALQQNLGHDNAAVRTSACEFAASLREPAQTEDLKRLLSDEGLDVRIRAAQALLALSQPKPEAQAAIVRDVYVATAQNPRYSEGSVAVLKDGTLLYATTEFIGSGSDFASAHIVGRRSHDGGRTWTDQVVLQKQTGKQNVMSVTLQRLGPPLGRDVPLGMFYVVKNSTADLKPHLRISHDEGRTFGEPIVVTREPGYHVLNNDRVLRLSNGRLLVPVASTSDVHKVNHFVSRCWFSDDDGQTWQQGSGTVDQPRRGAMEPDVFELQDGRVGMIVRTQLGSIAIAYSNDGGDTWGEPTSWNVTAPEAPATVRRIPATGDLLLVWNHNYTKGAGHGGKRTPLTAAVSSDDGRTWSHIRNLETRTDQSYAYTSLDFLKDRVLLSYYVRDENTGRISSRFRSQPLSWFYGRPAE